jgi:hypothetical protein
VLRVTSVLRSTEVHPGLFVDLFAYVCLSFFPPRRIAIHWGPGCLRVCASIASIGFEAIEAI